MVDVVADRRLYSFYDEEASPSLDELRRRYSRQSAGISPDGREVWHSWIVRERASGAAIGFVQATVAVSDDPSRTSAELAWVIGVPWQGRGLATEAARAVRDAVLGPGSVTGDDVAHLHAHIAPDHVASETVARRLDLHPTDVVHHGEIRWELAPDA